MTGYFARGTGCAGTTSVDFGLYLPDAEVLREPDCRQRGERHDAGESTTQARAARAAE